MKKKHVENFLNGKVRDANQHFRNVYYTFKKYSCVLYEIHSYSFEFH